MRAPAPPPPGSTLTTPAGKPAAAEASARTSTCSAPSGDGFRITEQPAIKAPAVLATPMAKGPLKGMMAATTPTGSWLTSAVLRVSGSYRRQIGQGSCRERVCQYGEIAVVD